MSRIVLEKARLDCARFGMPTKETAQLFIQTRCSLEAYDTACRTGRIERYARYEKAGYWDALENEGFAKRELIRAIQSGKPFEALIEKLNGAKDALNLIRGKLERDEMAFLQ